MMRASYLTVVLTLVACGQITGLSDDYQFVDGGATDGPRDAGARVDALVDGSNDASDAGAGTCSAQATASALVKMSGGSGTSTCKACLAAACCSDVETCTGGGECKNVLSCKLDCTSQADRTQCQSRCPANGAGAALYASGIGACGGRSCKRDCGFP